MTNETFRIDRLREFVASMTRLVEQAGEDELRMLAEGGELLGALVARDDWLPASFAHPHPEHYQQYLLHCDGLERFSVVSFVWGPGQKTPIHDHTVWGMIGQLRGVERSTAFAVTANGLEQIGFEISRPGDVAKVSPTIGDVHEVANADENGVSVSIHVYGANIGAVHRHVFDRETGAAKTFVSGYAAPTLPNLWDRSKE
jgi:predicted metal-dependent enzyme (double-stranded beta helix superfamily)